MKIIPKFALAALLGLGCTLALACEAPPEPALPDPDTAVTPQMVKAQNDVKAYLDDAKGYLDCSNSAKRRATMEKQMHEVADRFNAIVRAYKARMSG